MRYPHRQSSHTLRAASGRTTAIAAAFALALVGLGLGGPAANADEPPITISVPEQELTAPVGGTVIGVSDITATERVLITMNSAIPGFVTVSGPCAAGSPALLQAGESCRLTATFESAFVSGPVHASAHFSATPATEDGQPVDPAATTQHSVKYVLYANPFTVTTHDFGEVPLGESRTGTVTVTNANSGSLHGIDLRYAFPVGGPFTLAPGTATYLTLDPGQSREIPVVFTPTAAGAASSPFVPIYTPMNNAGIVQDPFLALFGTGVVPGPQTANLAAVAPQDRTVRLGETAAFSSSATSDSGSNAVRWEQRANDTAEWAPLPDPAGSAEQLTLPAATAAMHGLQVRAVWTNDAFGETVTTAPATLRVLPKEDTGGGVTPPNENGPGTGNGTPSAPSLRRAPPRAAPRSPSASPSSARAWSPGGWD